MHDETLGAYLKKISCYPRISLQKERELAKAIKKGKQPEANRAKEEMVLGNLRLVIAAASKIHKKFEKITSLSLMDLVNEGNLALVVSVSSYDVTHSSKAAFGSYAYLCIESRIMDAIKKNSSIIRIPENHFRYWAKIHKMTQENVPKRKIAEICGITIRQFDKIIKAKQMEFIPLDMPLEEGSSIGDMIPDPASQNPSDIIGTTSMTEYVHKKTFVLSQRERFVVDMMYSEYGPVSFKSIGQALGLSHERARQIHNTALSKMRKAIMLDRNIIARRLKEKNPPSTKEVFDELFASTRVITASEMN